ncbi:DUF6191 domain-containing protein [Streptomyces niger]|uniref:DUF6191 domain-containing protein n=1 Tax=Streptomyces niger TaxID=66373 RepID=UPI001F167860|nr:DUF6191 domain-containing protein [Streptomyces niger]
MSRTPRQGAAMFNLAQELFAPGRKHTEDERQKLSLVVTDVGDSDPGRGPIDLASGQVVVRLPRPASAASADPAASGGLRTSG